MPQVSRILASSIIAACLGSVAAADDTDASLPPPPPPVVGQETVTVPAASANQQGSGISLTDPISTTPKSPVFDPFASEPIPGRSRGNSSFSVRGGASKGNVSQGTAAPSDAHGAAASPFDDLAAPGQASGSPSTGLVTIPCRSTAPARVDSASAVSPSPTVGGLDASQAPTVCAHWVKKTAIVVGQECQCDLVVQNAGKSPARDVMVDAYFPVTVRLTHAEPMPADNTDHVTWSFPALGPSEERTIHIKLVPSRRGELSTTAVVRFASAASNTFSVEEPLLALTLRGPKELMVGDPATQTITVNNPGTGVAHNVAIEAHLTKGLEAPRGEQLVVQVGSLNPGESRVVRLPLIALVGGEQEIKIHAWAGNDLHRELSGKIRVVAPSLKVAVEGPNFRYVGRKAHYMATVTNDGGAPLNNIRVTHVVPEGFRFARADHGGEWDELSRTVTWNIEHLDVHQSSLVNVELVSTQIGKCVHAIAAVSEQGARSELKLETVVDGVASLAVEILKQSDPVEVGVETGFEVHVRNDGSKAAENVTIACDVPPELEVVRTEGATSAANTTGQLTFRPLPRLEPGKAAIYRVHVRARSEGSHRFGVRLTADSIKDPLTYTELTKFYKE